MERKEPKRYHLPDERKSLTHKFVIHGEENKEYKGYITVGFYEDGAPGEIFIRVAKTGSMVRGLLDTVAVSVSIALQYGIPLKVFVDKFSHVRFEPEGLTENKDIHFAKSLVDYIFRWLGKKFPELSD